MEVGYLEAVVLKDGLCHLILSHILRTVTCETIARVNQKFDPKL